MPRARTLLVLLIALVVGVLAAPYILPRAWATYINPAVAPQNSTGRPENAFMQLCEIHGIGITT